MKDEFSHHKALKLAADTQRAREHPRTNAERIRNMTDEELAGFLYSTNHFADDGEWVIRIGEDMMQDSEEDILDWLRKEVE